MSDNDRAGREREGIKRRDFVKTGGALLAGGAVSGRAIPPGRNARLETSEVSPLFPVKPSQGGHIQSYRTLGRTGFRVSDVSLGGSFLRDPSLVRYAFDKGMNYIDTAESYENGGADRAIRGALEHIDREAVFIASNADVGPSENKESVLEKALRLASIQWVLQNPDMHSVCVSAGTFDFIDEVVALSKCRSAKSCGTRTISRLKAGNGTLWRSTRPSAHVAQSPARHVRDTVPVSALTAWVFSRA